jgi:hypothetical protein
MQKFGKFVAVMFSPVLLVVLLSIAVAHHEAAALVQMAPKPGTTHTVLGSGPRAQAQSQVRHMTAVAPGDLPRVSVEPGAHRARAKGGTPIG